MAGNFDSNCPLCKLEKLTKWYYEDEEFVICDCEVCWVPMGVIREHGSEINNLEAYNKMLEKLTEVADQLYGKGNWWLDPMERTIRDHRHAHARVMWW